MVMIVNALEITLAGTALILRFVPVAWFFCWVDCLILGILSVRPENLMV